MADSGTQTATGNGEYLLPEAHLITAIQFWTETATVQVDYRSENYPRKQLHAGWIATGSGTGGVAFDELDPPDPTVTWWSYFNFQSQLVNEPSGFIYDDRISWNIPTGQVAKFIVWW